MSLVHDDRVVRAGGGIGTSGSSANVVRFVGDLLADGNLGREPDDLHLDFVLYEVVYGLVDVARVAGEERPEQNEHFFGVFVVVQFGAKVVLEHCSGHFQRVLKQRVSLGFEPVVLSRPKQPQLVYMVLGQAIDLGNEIGNAISHHDDAQLRDGILVEKLHDKLLEKLESHGKPVGPQVLFQHRQRPVNDDNQCSNDSSLERSGGVLHDFLFSVLDHRLYHILQRLACLVLVLDDIPWSFVPIFPRIPAVRCRGPITSRFFSTGTTTSQILVVCKHLWGRVAVHGCHVFLVRVHIAENDGEKRGE